ncbi:Anti-lipopolysaccharide factor [Chionoecetes opilio]|uniref:Anti-lipopolysaccharide factor n=1 Tax=Chionoecetes opilio TaxID=41210 RepID=A0A8J4Y361_CHIOP|nr:Anti-lipopolysaccharide factor [Chionoecetes opilio]
MTRLSLFLFVVAIATVAPCQGGWGDIIFDRVKNVLVEEGTTEVLDKICNFRVLPRLRGVELYFKGDLWCPGWTSIRGESFTRSRTRVVNKAIEDFAKKALKAGLILEADAQTLLNA